MITRILIICVLCLAAVSGTVLVYSRDNNKLVDQFQSLPAGIGKPLPEGGLRGYLVLDILFHGCYNRWGSQKMKSKEKTIVLLDGLHCKLETKLRTAQISQFDAVIFMNGNNSEIVTTTVEEPSGIVIPTVVVSGDTGKLLLYYSEMTSWYIVVNGASK